MIIEAFNPSGDCKLVPFTSFIPIVTTIIILASSASAQATGAFRTKVNCRGEFVPVSGSKTNDDLRVRLYSKTAKWKILKGILEVRIDFDSRAYKVRNNNGEFIPLRNPSGTLFRLKDDQRLLATVHRVFEKFIVLEGHSDSPHDPLTSSALDLKYLVHLEDGRVLGEVEISTMSDIQSTPNGHGVLLQHEKLPNGKKALWLARFTKDSLNFSRVDLKSSGHSADKFSKFILVTGTDLDNFKEFFQASEEHVVIFGSPVDANTTNPTIFLVDETGRVCAEIN